MKFLSLFFLSLANLSSVNSYLAVNSVKRYTRKFDDNLSVKVYEPKNVDKKNTHSVLFFTGGNALITSEVYTNFLSKLANEGLAVFISPSDLEQSEEISDLIESEYSSVTNIGHSSGAVVALKNANKNRNTKKTVLLDPVDSEELFKTFRFPNLPFLDNDQTTLKFKHIKDLLVLNAKKSYEWKLFPLTIPFVPAFKMDTEKITSNDVNVNFIEAENFGHSDILNPFWGDIMHKTISKGSEDRDETVLDEYHEWLASTINKFILNLDIEDNNNEKLDDCKDNLSPSDYETENIELE